MGTPKWVGTTATLKEQPGSPTTEFGEKAIRTQTFKGPYALCLSSALVRGTSGTGSDAGWIVARSTVSKERGAIGTLTIVWEAGGTASGASLPPVKFSCHPERISRPLKYHPRYAGLSKEQIDAVDKALEADGVRGNAFLAGIAAVALAMELYEKRKRGQENYYLAGLKYSYTTASWTMPSLTLGGSIETPDGPMSGDLPASSSWLRMADDFEFTGAHYEVMRSWIGSPAGLWDTDIYA